MRTFEKSSKLDHVLYDVRGPVVDEAARMEEAGEDSEIKYRQSGTVWFHCTGRSDL